MIVIIKNKAYRMSRTAAKGVLDVAKGSVKKGVYAVEKQNQIELLNIECKSSAELKRLRDAYKKSGFKVYDNG